MAIEAIIGELRDVPVGSWFESYKAMMAAGVHGVSTQGIWTRDGVAYSIVLNGGYPDDQDFGDVIFYTGAGGQNTTTKRQEADQTFDYAPNRALESNRQAGLPVRVIRGYNGDPERSPSSGYRYDGLYRIVESSHAWGSSLETRPFKMCMFTLERIDQIADEDHNDGETARSGRRSSDPEIRRIVERYAVAKATELLEQLGYSVTDVGVPGSPYDLRAVSDDEQLRVEVKGRVEEADTVEMTYREVQAAIDYPDAALIVVDCIEIVQGDNGPAARGGSARMWLEWSPAEDDLTATVYRYRLPPHDLHHDVT